MIVGTSDDWEIAPPNAIFRKTPEICHHYPIDSDVFFCGSHFDLTWVQHVRYKIPIPICRRCLVHYGLGSFEEDLPLDLEQ